jgi:hypothetical protein
MSRAEHHQRMRGTRFESRSPDGIGASVIEGNEVPSSAAGKEGYASAKTIARGLQAKAGVA